MQNPAILFPVIALAFWTFCVLLIVATTRFRSAFRGEVGFGDFRSGESSRVPAHVSVPNRNFVNLLETPLLFYVVCLLFYASGGVTHLVITLAWIFVALRIAHSLVHICYNNVFHRFIAFAASIFVLIAMWIFATLHVMAIHDVWKG